jgi:hypothetical protein
MVSDCTRLFLHHRLAIHMPSPFILMRPSCLVDLKLVVNVSRVIAFHVSRCLHIGRRRRVILLDAAFAVAAERVSAEVRVRRVEVRLCLLGELRICLCHV